MKTLRTASVGSLALAVASAAVAGSLACSAPAPERADAPEQSDQAPEQSDPAPEQSDPATEQGDHATEATEQPPARTEPSSPGRAAALFAQHCALCHGPRGRGDGQAASSIFPPCRDFGEGRFRLVRTTNGAPTDEDLIELLTRGMPGSSMPPFDWMSDADRSALATHVRTLAIEGMTARLTEGSGDEEPVDDSEALAIARERLTPSDRIDPGTPVVADAAALASGRRTFLRYCAVCHGEDARGRREEPRINAKGDLEWARDLTSGPFKGGRSHADLAFRVAAGMPGSTMPGTRFDNEEQRQALLAYLRTLVADEEGYLRRHQRFVARRVSRAPEEPHDDAWSDAEPIEVVLAPNAWRDDAIQRADLRALHDGTRLAVRISWPDATRNDRMVGELEPSDGVALLLVDAAEPPLYGMGSPTEPVDVWHWKAFRFEDAAGFLDLVQGRPHLDGDVLSDGSLSDATHYLPAPGRASPDPDAAVASAAGMDSARRFSADELGITATPSWSEGRWTVVFVRSLEQRAERELEIVPGAPHQVALALWNGAARDAGGQKSVSVWHELVLAD